MAERRAWSPEQDKTVKYLRDVLKVSKWSEISRRLEFEFHLPGRNGKQCRQRYTNHLDNSIKFSEINLEEEQKIFKLHDIVGNKWSQICKHFSGRTQNQIKNHFHSKLRKAIRKLNKQIRLHFKKSVKAYKLNIVYKIVEVSDFRFFSNLCVESELKFFNDLKNLLLQYAGGVVQQKSELTNLKGKDQTMFLVSKLDSFQAHLKQNKSLLSANRKSKKGSDRKNYLNNKTNESTQNSQISEQDGEIECHQEDSIFECQQSIIGLETGFQMSDEKNQYKPSLKTLDVEFDTRSTNEKTQKNDHQLQQTQITMLGEVEEKKSQIQCQKQELKIPQFINSLIEQQEFPENFMERKFSMKSFESLIQFEDVFLNEREVDMMLKRFQNFSNIQSSLFQ